MTNPQAMQQQPQKQPMTKEEWNRKVEYAMKVLQEQWRLTKNPLTQKQMKQLRYTLNKDWEQTERLQEQEKQEKRFALLYERFHFLNNHFLAWEEEREHYRRWKEEIEKRLNSFMEDATRILTTVSEQAQEIIDGNPKSKGEMMGLILGTLNELRDRVDGLENFANVSRASEKVRKS